MRSRDQQADRRQIAIAGWRGFAPSSWRTGACRARREPRAMVHIKINALLALRTRSADAAYSEWCSRNLGDAGIARIVHPMRATVVTRDHN